MNARRPVAVVLCFLTVVALGGCQWPEAPAAPVRTPAERDPLDPVAQRMHEVSGLILLFHGAYNRLPASLQELCVATGEDPSAVTDPATGRAIAYSSSSFASTSSAGKVIAYASPSAGDGACWCITFSEATGSAVCRVVPLPAADLLAPDGPVPPK
jgi:hypothetical protein